jgi:hypothetical protein
MIGTNAAYAVPGGMHGAEEGAATWVLAAQRYEDYPAEWWARRG